MKPIISPIWFYLVNLFGKVGNLAIALIIGGLILAIVLGVVETEGEFESDEERTKWYGFLKKSIIITILRQSCIARFHQRLLVTR